MPEFEPVSSRCLDAREHFAQALEDPAVERDVLEHCTQCADCMAVFVELRETVDKLMAAAEAVPPSKDFASSVFDSIHSLNEESRTLRVRKARMGLLVAAVLLCAGFGAVIGMHIVSDGDGKPVPVPVTGWEMSEEPGARENGAEPAPSPPRPDSGAKPSKPGPDPEAPKKAAASAWKGVLKDILDLESRVAAEGGNRRGRFKREIMEAMIRTRLLSKDDVSKLKTELENTRKLLDTDAQRRLRQGILNRLKDIQEGRFGKDGSRRGSPGRKNRKK